MARQLYVADGSFAELWIADVTNPGMSTEVGNFPAGLGSPGGLASHDGVLYVADDSGDELWIADVTNPGMSTEVGNFPAGLTFTYGLASHDGVLYAVDITGRELWIVNVTDPSTSTLVGQFPPGLTSPTGLASHDGVLYVADNGGDELWIADVTNPGMSTEVGEFPAGLASPQALASHDGVLYATDNTGEELWEVNVTNPGLSTEVGNFPSGLVSPLGLASHDDNIAPTVTIDTNAQTVDAGAALELASTVADPGDTYTVLWTGSGTFADADQENPTWTAPSPSTQTTYTLTLTATDSEGLTGTDTVDITVRAAPVAVDAGDVAFLFALPQPTVTRSHAYAVNAGDAAWAFALSQPAVTKTEAPAVDHEVDAGDVAVAFAVPQPAVTHALRQPAIDDIPPQTGEVVRMLVTAGTANRIYSRRGDTVGSVSADSDLTLTDSITVNRVQINAGQNWVRVFGDDDVDGLFGSGGAGENSDVMIATPYGTITLADVDTVQTGYGQWTTASAQSNILSQIQSGDMVLVVVYDFDTTIDYTVDAGDVDWAFALPQPSVTYMGASGTAFTANAGDAAWTFTVPQPSVSVVSSHNVAAGAAAWAFMLPQPAVTHIELHRVNPGDVAFVFTLPQPTVTHTQVAPQMYARDAGAASWAFAVPQPSIQFVGTQPTVSIVTVGRTVDAGGVIALTATASDPDGTIDTYAWTGSGYFVDAGMAATDWQAPYPSAQTGYTLTLTVTDNDGNMAADTVMMTARAAATGTIADAHGNETESFTGQAVTNNAI